MKADKIEFDENDLEYFTDAWKDNFSNGLLDRMNYHGYTQDSLAKEIGVSQKSVSKYLNKKAVPSAYALYRMTKVLRCTADDLVCFND